MSNEKEKANRKEVNTECIFFSISFITRKQPIFLDLFIYNKLQT